MWRQYIFQYHQRNMSRWSYFSSAVYHIYVDQLIKTIENSQIGCHIGHVYAGGDVLCCDSAVLEP